MTLPFTSIEYFMLLMFVFLSYLDIRSKTLPSFLTTSIILITAMVNLKNIEFGVLGFILGWLLMEGFTDDNLFFSGVADLKAMVMISLFATTLGEFMLMTILLLIFGLVYKVIIKKMFNPKEVAFLPVFLITYVTWMVLKLF
jgi:hypothetical protein